MVGISIRQSGMERKGSCRKVKGSLCQNDSWKSVCLCLSEQESGVTRGEVILSKGEEEKVESEKKLSDMHAHKKDTPAWS